MAGGRVGGGNGPIVRSGRRGWRCFGSIARFFAGYQARPGGLPQAPASSLEIILNGLRSLSWCAARVAGTYQHEILRAESLSWAYRVGACFVCCHL